MMQNLVAMVAGMRRFVAVGDRITGKGGASWRSAKGRSANVINKLNHPYYWAPFILIGNGL